MVIRRPAARRTALNVSLPARQRRLVDQVVCDGEYASASEVVRESLRVWESERARRAAAIDALPREIQVGNDHSQRGETPDGSRLPFARGARGPGSTPSQRIAARA
jgi:antitoxin ParD1/3/4